MIKKSTRTVFTVILLIPLFLIAYFLLSINIQKPTGATLKSINISRGGDGGFSSSYTDKDEFSDIMLAVSGAAKTENPVRDISGDTVTNVVFVENDGTERTFEFYLSNDTDECYCKDSDGVLYKFAKSDAEALILKEEFAYVYPNAYIPTATMTVGEKQIPLYPDPQSEWKFKRSGEWTDGVAPLVTEKNDITFEKNAGLKLSFPTEPASLVITLSTQDTMYTFNTIEAFEDAMSQYTSDTHTSCKINAKWNIEDEGECFGDVNYDVDMLFDVPASYCIVDSSGVVGDFTIVEFYDFNDGEKAKLVSDVFERELVIHEDGGNKFALIPFDISLNDKAASTDIKILSGDTEIRSITAKNKGFTVKENQNIPKELFLNTTGTDNLDDGKESFEQLIEKYTSESADTRLWSDTDTDFAFASPIASPTYGSPRYGARVNSTVISTAFSQNGIILKTTAGTNVAAIAGGRIVDIGENEYYGNYVIIDHGLGVISAYCHLDKSDRSVGDTLKKGDTLGVAGKTGFLFEDVPQTEVFLSFDGIFVDPSIHMYKYGLRVSKRTY